MAVERRLTELVGSGRRQAPHGPVAKRPGGDRHGAVRARARRARRRAAGRADGDARRRSPSATPTGRCPGYTHLQRAQPVYLGHHLLAYFWMLAPRRPPLRRGPRRGAPARCRWAPALWPGSTGSSTARATAAELGFDRPGAELDRRGGEPRRRARLPERRRRSALPHLSRLGSELVLWSSQEFGFCEPADDFSSGSSIMPQKKNPDAAELLRGKAPRVAASLQTLLGVLHALPLAYAKDLQEDKEALFDAVDTDRDVPARPPSGCSPDCASTASGWPRPPADEFLAATDVADLLVRRGMPFREAHGVVGSLVREALASGRVALRAHRRTSSAPIPSCSTTSTTRCWRATPGSSRSCRPGAPRRRGWPSSSRRPARPWPSSRRMSVAAHGSAGRPCCRGRSSSAPCSRSRATSSAARSCVDGVGGVIVETEAYRARRAGLPRLRRPDGADRAAVRPARARLRLPLLRHPQPAERRRRARG